MIEAEGFSLPSHSIEHCVCGIRLYVVNQPVDRERLCKPTILPDGRTVFRCIFCRKDFLSYSDINRHMDFHEGQNHCRKGWERHCTCLYVHVHVCLLVWWSIHSCMMATESNLALKWQGLCSFVSLVTIIYREPLFNCENLIGILSFCFQTFDPTSATSAITMQGPTASWRSTWWDIKVSKQWLYNLPLVGAACVWGWYLNTSY